MAAITHDAIRKLAEFKGQGDHPVVSLYLDVDGSRFVRAADYEQQLDALMRQAAHRANGDGRVAEELKRVDAFVKGGIDRSRTRGIALFSCAKEGLWQVFELPVPVRNHLVVNQTPHVRQLEAILDTNERFGVLLADKQRARMFVFELGAVTEKSELFEQLPRHEDDKGEWRRDHVRDHVANAAHQHLRRAAQVAFEVYKAKPFDHLVIGAPDEIANELEHELHSYLRERIAARLPIAVGARDEEIRLAALAVEAEIEKAKEAALVERLRNAVGSGSGGIVGLGPVLAALVERRVDTLIVSDGFEAPGWRCRSCGHVAIKGRRCPTCAADMDMAEDVVEEAVEEALMQSCRVAVCVGNADLDVLGRIGALLRF